MLYPARNYLYDVNGEADGWVETDEDFCRFEPSLSTLLKEYVEAIKDEIFD